MIRFLALFFAFIAVPASAATVETKYFTLYLPEIFKPRNIEQYKIRDEGKIAAYASQKQVFLIEYVNKEKWPSKGSEFEHVIESANKDSDNFEGKKVEPQECEVECVAYYRESRFEVTDASGYGYQYFVKGQNTWLFLGYVDAVHDHAVSHAMMQDFIKRIKARGL